VLAITTSNKKSITVLANNLVVNSLDDTAHGKPATADVAACQSYDAEEEKNNLRRRVGDRYG
jgi:hypothetical protein